MCGTALPDICWTISTRLAAQAANSTPDVDVISDNELVLVLDELGQRTHLRAPTVDGCAGVLGGLESKHGVI